MSSRLDLGLHWGRRVGAPRPPPHPQEWGTSQSSGVFQSLLHQPSAVTLGLRVVRPHTCLNSLPPGDAPRLSPSSQMWDPRRRSLQAVSGSRAQGSESRGGVGRTLGVSSFGQSCSCGAAALARAPSGSVSPSSLAPAAPRPGRLGEGRPGPAANPSYSGPGRFSREGPGSRSCPAFCPPVG